MGHIEFFGIKIADFSMTTSRTQAIQQPTASVRQRIATGVIAELISLQPGYDGRQLAW